MADEGTFLQMLAEHPADAEVRLIYADWLEETGRVGQAELLRHACEFARMPFDDPELVRKSRVLLGKSRKLDPAWLHVINHPHLDNTCWGTRDHEGVPYVVGFLPKGQLEYRRVDEHVRGRWGEGGNAIRFDINGYSEHVGAFVGDRMRGDARNDGKGTWNWELARLDDRFLEGDFPDLPPEPMDTNYRSGSTRDSGNAGR